MRANEVQRAVFHRASYLFQLEEVRRRLVEAAELGLHMDMADERGGRQALEADVGPEVEELLRGGGEGARNRLHEAIPARGLLTQATASERGEAVVLRLAVVLRRPPFARDKPLVLEAVQRGIQRALLDEECAAGDLLDPEQHAIAVQLAQRYGLEDEEIERAGKQSRGIGQGILLNELGGA